MLVKGKVVEQAALAAKALEETKENKSFLPLNLQYFAGDDGGSGDGGSNDDDPGAGGDDPGTGNDDDDPGTDDDKQDNKSGGKKKSNTFTQDDVNAIAAKEAKKAQEKLLKQLGVKDAKDAKDALEQFKKMQDDQKTDVQKAADRAKQLEDDYNSLSSENKTLKAQLAGLKAGVKAESLDDVIVLADKLVTEDVTIDDAVKQVLKKYPQFGQAPADDKSTKKPKFSDGDHKKDDKVTDEDKWTQAFKWGN